MEMNAISSINFNARTSRKKRPKIMLNKTNISKMTDDEKHSWVAGFVIGSALSAAVLGGGTSVYTTDFHSLDPTIRASNEDMKHRKFAPVVIGDNVFVGAKCIILKGVTIGENSIIGAGSVVTKSIPANEIWAGNPAKFIRKI